jgi:hypothetical protein
MEYIRNDIWRKIWVVEYVIHEIRKINYSAVYETLFWCTHFCSFFLALGIVSLESLSMYLRIPSM